MERNAGTFNVKKLGGDKNICEENAHIINMRVAMFLFSNRRETRQKRRPRAAVVQPFLVALKAEFSLHMRCEAL